MTNEAEKMAREYSEPREWAEDHYEHWEDIDPVEAAEDGYRAGYLAGQQSLWIPVSERLPEDSREVLASDGICIHLAHYTGNEGRYLWGCDTYGLSAKEVTHWQPITLPATKEGA